MSSTIYNRVNGKLRVNVPKLECSGIVVNIAGFFSLCLFQFHSFRWCDFEKNDTWQKSHWNLRLHFVRNLIWSKRPTFKAFPSPELRDGLPWIKQNRLEIPISTKVEFEQSFNWIVGEGLNRSPQACVRHPASLKKIAVSIDGGSCIFCCYFLTKKLERMCQVSPGDIQNFVLINSSGRRLSETFFCLSLASVSE